MDLLYSKDGKIFYGGVKMEVFVPSDYFKRRYIEEIGSQFFLFGILETIHYDNEDDPRSKGHKASLQYPGRFYTCPDSVSKEKIDIGQGTDTYTILTYHRGSILFDSTEMIKNSDNVQFYLNQMMRGKLDIMEYGDIASLFQICKDYNGVDLAVPASYEETLIAEYYRNPKDITKPARFTATSNGYYARGITEREKVSFTSTFSAITFEDVYGMLTTSVNAKNEGRPEAISEAEKVSLGLD